MKATSYSKLQQKADGLCPIMRLHTASKSITLVIVMFFRLEVAAKDEFTALI